LTAYHEAGHATIFEPAIQTFRPARGRGKARAKAHLAPEPKLDVSSRLAGEVDADPHDPI
jgi:hypothetical protein